MTTSVALVTLGCARNEVDSEELAGRLAAGGFTLVDDPADADTVVVNTCGFVEQAKKDSVDTLLQAADLKDSGRTQAVVAVGCLAERYGDDLAESLPEADAVLGFDDYPDIAARLQLDRGRRAHQPTPRRTDASCCRSRPVAARPGGRPRGRIPGHAPASLARSALDKGPTAQPQARQRLRPALLLLRDPELPRLVRQPPPDRGARRGAVAGRPGCPRAVPGQRELHVLRQGPRRPPPPRDAAARARRRSTASSGCASPTSSRPRPGPGWSRRSPDARRRAVLRPLLPARQRPGAAADAPLRRRRELPRPARPGPRPGAAGRRPLQRHRRLPRRDRGRPRDALRLPGGRPDGRHRRLRLLRRGRHRGGRLRRQARRGRGARPRRARHRARRGADGPAGRGAHRRDRRGARGVPSRTARSSAGRLTRARRSTVRRTCWRRRRRGRRPGRAPPWSASEGVDLVAELVELR